MTSWITRRTADKLPSLKDLNDQARAQLLTDADRIERHVRRNEFIDDAELRRYGERNDLPPDRLNPALAFLEQTGQLLKLGDGR